MSVQRINFLPLMISEIQPRQWMAGFCRIMREDPVAENRDFMLDYAINLLEDAMDFSWSSAKAMQPCGLVSHGTEENRGLARS